MKIKKIDKLLGRLLPYRAYALYPQRLPYK